MTEAEIREQIPGAASFIEWFGQWPRFHDAHVLDCDLKLVGESTILLHTFKMTNETDERGYFILDKHAMVTFGLKEIQSLEIADFNQRSILFGLTLKCGDDGFQVTFDPSFGLSGTISAKQLRLEWARGKPDEGVYV